ncbi:3',5'-cyclic adenosine monophosphate phosphodiesterase CpdA [Pelomyxa schiedti]|nr:3',5'-cyclic adenosine monophosphate phosphodiesterase CpdA [Pelomyxa schiedti]
MLMRCEAARYFMRFSAQVFGFLLLSLWPCLAYEIVLAAAGEDHVNELAAGISILALVSVVFVIGLVNGRALVVRRFTIKSSKVRTTTTIAHISDLHIGSRSASWCSKVVDKVNSLHPDYVVITGDLVDTAKLRARDLKAIERISVPVLICLGNHDFWVKEGELENLLPGIADDESSNKPIILRDSILSDSGKDEEVQFLGIDDVERASEFNLRYDALAASSQFDSSKFTVLLHHRPHNAGVTHVAKTAKVDLFLSGHTHAGQMYPMNFLVMIAFRHVSGFFRKDSTSFYVSPGTGTWGPAVRLWGESVASDIAVLRQERITHVVNCAVGIPNYFEGEMKYLRLSLRDSPSEDFLRVLPIVLDWMNAIPAEGNKLLIHCREGNSRSAAVVIMLQMARKRLSLKSAYSLLKSVRPSVWPNSGYWRQLAALEAELGSSESGVIMGRPGTDLVPIFTERLMELGHDRIRTRKALMLSGNDFDNAEMLLNQGSV